MTNDGKSKLERFLNTVSGARFLEEAEADADRKETAVQHRRDFAAERAEFHRRRRDVEPELDRAAEAAWEVANRAKAEHEVLRKKAADAGRAAHSEFLRINDGIRRTEAQLAHSADPRLHGAVEEADEVLRTWSETCRALHRWRSEKATSWDGTDTWVKRYGSNEAGVDAMQKGVEDARAAVKNLMLVPEPGDEAIEAAIANLHAAFEACHGDPPPLVMQQFDSKGQPVGRPVQMPVAR